MTVRERRLNYKKLSRIRNCIFKPQSFRTQKTRNHLEMNAVCYSRTHLEKRNRGRLGSKNASENVFGMFPICASFPKLRK